MSWQDWHDDYQTFIWHFQFTSRLYLHWASISTISNFIFRVGLFMPQHITSDQNRIIHRLIRRGREINSHTVHLKQLDLTQCLTLSQYTAAKQKFLWFQSKQCHLVVPSLAVRRMGTISAGMPCYRQPWAEWLLTSHWLPGWHPGLWLVKVSMYSMTSVLLTWGMWGLNYTNIQAAETRHSRPGDQRPAGTIIHPSSILGWNVFIMWIWNIPRYARGEWLLIGA